MPGLRYTFSNITFSLEGLLRNNEATKVAILVLHMLHLNMHLMLPVSKHNMHVASRIKPGEHAGQDNRQGQNCDLAANDGKKAN